jgi:hypothetical protein
MGFDANGTFNRLHNRTRDAAGNEKAIRATRVDEDTTDIANGLSQWVLRDGRGKISAAFDFNDKKDIGISEGQSKTDVVNKRQLLRW